MEILSFLYLGSAYHASRKDMLDALGITALINVSANCPNHFEGHYQYKSIPVEDNHKADISSWFNEAIDFIGKWNGCPGPPLSVPTVDTESSLLGGSLILTQAFLLTETQIVELTVSSRIRSPDTQSGFKSLAMLCPVRSPHDSMRRTPAISGQDTHGIA